ncbi:MAG: hypothetical protein WC651_02695 [Candidatus Gracilibacteria bacterium]|jgi:uncharacterized protein YrrD
MININENTIMVQTSELRTGIPGITKEIKEKKVILTKRGKPIAIIQDFQTFNEREKLLEEYEDVIFGFLAKSRAKTTSRKKYISHEEMIKKLGLL